jgi:hypothetical protein
VQQRQSAAVSSTDFACEAVLSLAFRLPNRRGAREKGAFHGQECARTDAGTAFHGLERTRAGGRPVFRALDDTQVARGLAFHGSRLHRGRRGTRISHFGPLASGQGPALLQSQTAPEPVR